MDSGCFLRRFIYLTRALVSLSPLSLTQILQGFKGSEESGGFVLIAEREERVTLLPSSQRDAATYPAPVLPALEPPSPHLK